MRKNIAAVALLSVLAVTAMATGPARAQNLDMRFVTADGTWDCRDPMDTKKGTIVLANTSYAFIGLDGKLAGYGDLYAITDNVSSPRFSVLNGHLIDEFEGRGLAITGPRGDFENFRGELFLYVAVSTDREKNWYCTRRD